jgi:hypothetical protein
MKNIGRREFITALTTAGVGMSTLESLSAFPNLSNEIKRIGIIGLDTSQDTMIISHINNLKGDGFDVVQPTFGEDVAGFKVVAAFPYGSRKIESSIKQIPTYVKRMKEVGVEIVDSIDTLLSKVDAVLLMTFDGHPRLEQALQVIKAGKPMFVNKPFAASLKDVVAIIAASKQYNSPIFSSSPTRYLKGAQAARAGMIGEITGADTYSAAPLEPSHPDFYWYGVHGIEILYTIMGTGCKEVRRTNTANTDIVVGTWKDDRLGTYRGIRKGKATHSGIAFGSNKILPAGDFNDVGHRPLVVDMLRFFRTGVTPVSLEETLEIYTFMEAADESKRLNGATVSLEAVLQKSMQ